MRCRSSHARSAAPDLESGRSLRRREGAEQSTCLPSRLGSQCRIVPAGALKKSSGGAPGTALVNTRSILTNTVQPCTDTCRGWRQDSKKHAERCVRREGSRRGKMYSTGLQVDQSNKVVVTVRCHTECRSYCALYFTKLRIEQCTSINPTKRVKSTWRKQQRMNGAFRSCPPSKNIWPG